MTFAPFIRWPTTDLTGELVSHQYFGRCQDFELKVMECLEAYGLDRGMKQCDVIIRDFRECHTRSMQVNRALAMRMERHKQYLKGERKEHYAEPPKLDAF